MKNKILSGCLMAASMFLASSCSDFLTEDPKGRLTPESFYTNQNEVDMAVYAFIIRKSKFPQNPKRSVRFSGKRTKRSVQKRKARNTQKAETKVL